MCQTRGMRWSVLPVAVALCALPRTVRADERFAATAFVGLELAHVDAPALDLRTPATSDFPLRYALPGTAFGALATFRFGALAFGLAYRRTQFLREVLSSDKVFAEAEADLRRRFFVASARLGVGYANLGGDARTAHGAGGELAVAFDFFPLRALSIGASTAFDLAVYAGDAGALGSYGATFLFRVGLHV